MEMVTLTESEQREIDKITQEFKTRGGMNDDELISRLGAIPFDDFMKKISEKIQNYKPEYQNISYCNDTHIDT